MGGLRECYFYIQAYDEKQFLTKKFFHVPTGSWTPNEDYCTWFPTRQAATAYLNEFGLNNVAEVRVRQAK